MIYSIYGGSDETLKNYSFLDWQQLSLNRFTLKMKHEGARSHTSILLPPDVVVIISRELTWWRRPQPTFSSDCARPSRCYAQQEELQPIFCRTWGTKRVEFQVRDPLKGIRKGGGRLRLSLCATIIAAALSLLVTHQSTGTVSAAAFAQPSSSLSEKPEFIEPKRGDIDEKSYASINEILSKV